MLIKKVMTKSKYFVVLLIAFLTLTVNAQRKEDVLYLHNGSIYRGKVLESITGVSTKIEITGRNIIVVPDTLIKMILMDQKVPLFDRESKSSPVEMAARANFYGGTKNTGGFTFITSYPTLFIRLRISFLILCFIFSG